MRILFLPADNRILNLSLNNTHTCPGAVLCYVFACLLLIYESDRVKSSEKMENPTPSEDHKHNPQSESGNDTKFKKSLQELKDLCSQLHHAADSYQSTFLNSNQKQLIVKNTKEYLHSALVTVVDHLGSVSANLDHHLSKTSSIYQTEVKISILNQKLLTCQDYSHKIALAKVSERVDNPKYNSRYIKPPISDVFKQNKNFSESKSQIAAETTNRYDEFKIDEEVPLFLYTCNRYKRSSLLQDPISVQLFPVRDNLSDQPKSQSFQLKGKSKSKRGILFLKSRPNNEILSVGGSRRI